MELVTDFQLEYTVIEGDTPPCAAIIVAAGNATRMGGCKQLIPLLGIPVLARSMMALEQCDGIRDIVVVAREEDAADIQKLADQYNIRKLTAVVSGGEERRDSVAKGLEAVAPDIVYIAIHDGARPLITPELIGKTLDCAKAHGAAALGVPVKNTIKRVNEDGQVLDTLERSCLMAVQTPQIFDISIYKQALAFAKEHPLAVTDDCSICEAAGFPVYIVEGSYRNLKITTPEDVIMAEALLARENTHD